MPEIIDAKKVADHISRRDDIPIHQQYVELLEMWTLSGAVKPGDLMPTVRDLANALAVSTKTANRCHQTAKSAGLVTVEGNRTYCAKLTAAQRRQKEKRYTDRALEGILSLRETGVDKAEVRRLIDAAYAMERGPYAIA